MTPAAPQRAGALADVSLSREAGRIVSNAHVWRAAQDRLRQQMTRAQFDTWLRGTWLDVGDDGATVLRVRTTFAKELLETRFRERIEAAVSEVTGKPCRLSVSVATGDQDAQDEPVPVTPAAQTHAGASARHRVQHPAQHNGASGMPAPSLFESLPEVHASPSAAVGTLSRHVPSLSAPRRRGVSSGPLRPSQRRSEPPSLSSNDAPPPSSHDGPLGTDAQAPASATERSGSGAGAGEWSAPVDMPAAAARDTRLAGAPPGARAAQEQSRSPLDDFAGPDPRLMAPQLTPPRLNARYTFSTFIVGSGNQLAHAASQAVAEAPGQAYNPLFLYGGVGLGKTHLLHAIGHTAIEDGLAVLYVSSETFTNEIINAIRFRTTEEFRAKYRSVDVLLVDDIQFIAGKDSTEEEFFHTFNALYENNKQIVVCSDRPPKAIVSLAERLRSRFEWGLIADIQPPDLETRVAILRAKTDSLGRQVPDEVLTYLANRVQSNIRELEGSFNRLLAVSQLQGLPLTIETAKGALANLASDSQQRRVSVAAVLDAVAEYYRISGDDLRGKQRDKHIVGPRQVAMYLMREETEASLLEVGQALGGRDHSTVLHGVEKIARELNDNTALRKDVNSIRQQLLG